MQFIYKSVRESEDLFFVIWRDRHDKWIIMTLLNANREFFEDMKYYVVHLLILYPFSVLFVCNAGRLDLHDTPVIH